MFEVIKNVSTPGCVGDLIPKSWARIRQTS